MSAVADGPRWPLLLQHSSDFALLVETTERAGLYFTLDGSVLRLVSLDGSGGPVVLARGANLFEARFESHRAPAPARFTGWTPGTLEPADDGDEGAGSLLLNLSVPGAGHLMSLAESTAARRESGRRTFRGTADGDPALRPGARVRISGVDSSCIGEYVLTSATHAIDREGGYLTELSSEPPEPRTSGRGGMVTPGAVTRVDDPAGLGRIRATLPAFGGLESDWLQVVLPAIGAETGLMALPDTGDSVLVLLPDGDPSSGIVLGSVLASTSPSDDGVSDGAVQRYTLRTRSGNRLILDEQGRSLRLENAGGSSIELGPDLVKLHSAANLEIEAPGRAIVIRGQSVDFQQQ
jgi:phage baseplate assembly protein gpV